MQDDRHSDPNSVYQKPDESAHPRAFYVDVWDEDTDSTTHRYYGVTHPDGDGGIARGIEGGGTHLIRDPETLAYRVGGEVVWI